MNAKEFKALNQASVAQAIGVDRTTIRAWTEAGMPYTAPKGRGHEGVYNGSVALYWAIGTGRCAAGAEWPEVKPITFIALAYAASNLFDENPADRRERRNEAIKLFPGLAPEHFTRDEHLSALNYAIGYLDAMERKPTVRRRR